MEKRFIAFVVASVAIMAGFMLLQTFFAPKLPPAKKPIPLAEKKIGKDDQKKNDADKKADTPKKPTKADDDQAQARSKPAAKQPPPQWVSLGSLDPTTGHRILATFNNQGAVLERVELSSPDYVDLVDHTGYLGHLALTRPESGDGCLVNVVGHGTPAAGAKTTQQGVKPGLERGDVIHAIDGATVAGPAAFDELLNKTKPGQSVALDVTRDVGGKSVRLVFTVDLIRRPMEIIRPEFGTPADPLGQHPLSLLLTLYSIGPVDEEETTEAAAKIKRGEREIDGLPSLHSERWQVKTLEGDAPGVEFRFALDQDALEEIGQTGSLEVVKRFRLAPAPPDKVASKAHKSYHLEFELEFVNKGDKPLQVAYQLGGPTGLPLEGWWYQNKIHPGWAGAGARDVICKTTGIGHTLIGCPLIYDNAIGKPSKPHPLFGSSDSPDRRQLHYAGVDAQYFTSALLPYNPHEQAETSYPFDQADARTALDAIAKEKSGRKVTDVTFQLVSPPNKVAAGESFKQSFILFAGPKEPELLSEYGLDRAIEYGWFRLVVRPLINVLHFFRYYVVHNWGLAIIMLTLLVRGCLFPIGRRMAKNMQAMQDLAPEVKAIKEKYKDDLAKQGKAQQELFRKHNINPYAGCLPLFLQMPIFIGLYRALSVDIALRQAPLIPGLHWCSNLAGPDMLWYWKPYLPDFLANESGYLGPYFNILPLITAGLFLVQQKLFTPPPTDEQQEMQQKMMNFMTIFMSVMFFKVPAGLCIYFITSSIWGIIERKFLIPKRKAPGEQGVAIQKKSPPKSGPNGASHKDETRKKQKKV